MNRNRLLNLNFKYDSNKDLTIRPLVEDYDNTTLYMYDLEKHLELIKKITTREDYNELIEEYKKITRYSPIYIIAMIVMNEYIKKIVLYIHNMRIIADTEFFFINSTKLGNKTLIRAKGTIIKAMRI